MRYLSCLAVLLLVSCFTVPAPSDKSDESPPRGTAEYQPPRNCINCHKKQYEQFACSAHASSFDNPVFQAQYFGEVALRTGEGGDLTEEALRCIACHAPVAYRMLEPGFHPPRDLDRDLSGVTCDFCHTVSGHEGRRPENGNYVSRPGPRKFGPFRQEGDWHHVYSPFVTRSEYCAVCHQARNRFGLTVKDTYREWRLSSFYKRNIHCQDCHMSLQGFLAAGKAVYESGTAARMALKVLPERNILYSHRFPGAHTQSQIEGALGVEVRPVGEVFTRGREASFIVVVDNERTGHKMPTGSADLRTLCIKVSLSGGGWTLNLQAGSKTGDTAAFDLWGEGPFDDGDPSESLLPRGSRVYRCILGDSEGRPTLAFYDADRVLFDNRLEAGEKRLEHYSVRVPEHLEVDSLTLSAALYYVPYPGRFADRYKAPQPKPVLITTYEREIGVR